MEQKQKSNKFLNTIMIAGNWIYNIFLLQFLWLLYTLRGVVFFGVFPSIAGIVHVAYRWFSTKEIDFSVSEEFRRGYLSQFKQANQIGYILLAAAAIFYLDIRVSNVFIQSIILHTLLLFLGLLVLCMALYTFTVLARYEYSLGNIFKQSFFVALSAPVYTAAAVISSLMVIELLRNYLFLLLFFGIPLLIIPVVWFTYTGILTAEKRKAEGME